MDLYILRHAIAVERGTPGYKNDFDRPLTSEGEQKFKRIAKAMRRMDLSFDLILSSPYIRARQTAEIAARVLSQEKRVQLRDSLGSDADPREFLAEAKGLKPLPESLLIVGHEPYLSTLVSLLVCGLEGSCIILKKGGLCKLNVRTVRAGRSATLEWLLTPRQMTLM